VEVVGDVGGVDVVAVGGGEDQTGVVPARPGVGSVMFLPVAVGVERVDGCAVDGDDGVAAVGFGLLQLCGPADLGELPPDGQGSSGEVEVGPVQAAGLAAAQSAVGDEVV
jgi:hypothetical protein